MGTAQIERSQKSSHCERSAAVSRYRLRRPKDELITPKNMDDECAGGDFGESRSDRKGYIKNSRKQLRQTMHWILMIFVKTTVQLLW